MKDLIILGNGMAGMTAALYAKRANLDFKIVGKDEFDFGQIGNAILVENYPCAAGLSGFDLAMKLHDQLEANDIQIEEHEVTEISKEIKSITKDNGFYYNIKYIDGTFEEAKTIIYALGAAPRKLNCKIDEEVSIHYCALCDGALYKDKRVAVIGGGDVAFTQAEYLSKICKEVRILMCDHNVTASLSTFERVSKIHNIYIDYDCPVARVTKDTDGVLWIWCEGVRGPIFAEGIFVSIGMIPNTAPLADLHIRNNLEYVLADETCKTPVSGLFAAGDVRTKKVRQALTAAADGAIAVQSVVDYLKSC